MASAARGVTRGDCGWGQVWASARARWVMGRGVTNAEFMLKREELKETSAASRQAVRGGKGRCRGRVGGGTAYDEKRGEVEGGGKRGVLDSRRL